MIPMRVLAVARGEAEADLLLTNCRVLNVFTGEVLPGQVAVAGGVVASAHGPSPT